ncbi:unnamed protein product, partial [Rangifer tarandus platyrhynchus]
PLPCPPADRWLCGIHGPGPSSAPDSSNRAPPCPPAASFPPKVPRGQPVLPWVSPDHGSLPTNPHSVLTSSLFPAPSHHSSFPGGLLGASWRNSWPESGEVPRQAGGSAHTPGTAPNSSSHEPAGREPSGAVEQGGEALPMEARRAQGSLGKGQGCRRSRQSEQMREPQGHRAYLLQDPGGKIEDPWVSNSKLRTRDVVGVTVYDQTPNVSGRRGVFEGMDNALGSGCCGVGACLEEPMAGDEAVAREMGKLAVSYL